MPVSGRGPFRPSETIPVHSLDLKVARCWRRVQTTLLTHALLAMNRDHADHMNPLELHALEALHERAKHHMAFLVSDQTANWFSGTAFIYMDRFFLVTSNHSIAKVQDNDSLRVYTYGNQSTGISVPGNAWYRFTDRHGSKVSHRLLDVAIAEVPPSFIEESGLQPVPHQLLGSDHLRPGSKVVVAGFPYALRTEKEQRISATPVIAQSIVQSNNSVPQEGWSTPLDPTADFLVAYDEEGKLLNDGPNDRMPRFEPHGMSGCGVFSVVGAKPDEVWLPELALVGIQSGWKRGSPNSVLRVNRIELVAELLGEALE